MWRGGGGGSLGFRRTKQIVGYESGSEVKTKLMMCIDIRASTLLLPYLGTHTHMTG